MKASLSEDFLHFIIHDDRDGVGDVKYLVKEEKYYRKIMYNSTESHGGFKIRISGVITGKMIYLGIPYVFNSANHSGIELIKVEALRKKVGRYRFR